ncbi:heavy-metal-associated domain-containing protein [Sutterella sp. AM11-39]|uniref:heavy-metal-associated domain-containing protein n=1 Tax=Sutterella sp. AM11-39 TaxID=2292075 RepID=UPI000E531479|nr:heavy metal-associated domain-containing protein [Sutterella sp. AM11-39]RHJ33973.1 heavy-metal-associated domain-containing protein [Sutterella sp. AM11-39]HJA17197.1 heavy-metal-associated domain-containing protein [Candidatus Duodenibacillus intestinigallinarum]
MIKTIIGVGGMSCQMCEAHINESVRSVVPDAKTIRANRKTRQVVIVSEGVIDKAALQQAIVSQGYDFLSYEYGPYESESFIVKIKGLFS